MLNTWRITFQTAGGALAVGAFLLLWLAIWPFWIVLNHHFPVHFSARSYSRH
jgi:hypothetical protein